MGGGSADPRKHEITRYCYQISQTTSREISPTQPRPISHSYTSHFLPYPLSLPIHLTFLSSPLPSTFLSRSLFSPPPPPVNVSLSLSSCPPPPPSFLLYHFIGLLVPLEMPNDKQSKPSEPLPCCPHRAADSKQTGYELKHSHSPPPPAHHKSSYRI